MSARVAEVLQRIERLVAGDSEARGTPSGRGDEVDCAIEGLSAVADELASLRALRDKVRARVDGFVDVIAAVTSQSYTKYARIEGEDDPFDGLAAAVNKMVEEVGASTALVKNILASMDDAVITVDLEGTISSANEAAYEMLGHAAGELRSLPLSAVLSGPLGQRRPAELLEGLGESDDEESCFKTQSGELIPVSLSASAMRDARGHLLGAVCVARDITERRRSELERDRLQEALRLQAAAILEMSTPLIPISDEIVVMPLVGAVDPGRAEQALDALLSGIERFHARVAILDITGVPVVDTQVAAGLLRAVSAARLVGADVVLTGIRADVAKTLVSLDVDLRGVATLSTLKSGVAYAQRRA